MARLLTFQLLVMLLLSTLLMGTSYARWHSCMVRTEICSRSCKSRGRFICRFKVKKMRCKSGKRDVAETEADDSKRDVAETEADDSPFTEAADGNPELV
ncbi:hypothetical protein ACOMHN_053898 [Nucella lapillus]